MHAFDHLIALANLRGVLDLNCHLQGSWALDHPPLAAGQASYHLVLDGHCRLEVPGRATQALSAGDIVLLPRSAVHVLAAGEAKSSAGALRKIQQPGRITQLRQAGVTDTGSLTMLCGRIHYTPNATLLAALPEVLVLNAGTPDERDRLAAIITLMRLEAEGEQLANQSVVDGLSVILFTLMLRYVCEHQRELPGIFALLRDKRLARAAMAVLEKMDHDWNVEALAALASMSRSSFMRSFYAAAGVAPAAWLTHLRLERAQLLLERSAAPISDIALAVGYPTLSSFSRVFKQHTGQAPAHYRQRLNTQQRIAL